MEAIDLKVLKTVRGIRDVLLQVIFRVVEENGQFTIADVIHCVSEKMVHRHEHVFGKDVRTRQTMLLNFGRI